MIDPRAFQVAHALRIKLRELNLVQDADPEDASEYTPEDALSETSEEVTEEDLSEALQWAVDSLQTHLVAEGFTELVEDAEWQGMTLEAQLDFLAETLDEGVFDKIASGASKVVKLIKKHGKAAALAAYIAGGAAGAGKHIIKGMEQRAQVGKKAEPTVVYKSSTNAQESNQASNK